MNSNSTLWISEAELEAEDEEWLIYGAFDQFCQPSEFFEDKGIEIVSAEFERIPTDYKGSHSRTARTAREAPRKIRR